MNNWFYMDRMAFHDVLINELGRNLTHRLLSKDFDTPISFMIGETAGEILTKIQQTFSRTICGKIICNDHCISCSLYPPTYAKLIWFVQRLLIMSPISKPFIKQTSLSNQDFIHIKDKNVKMNTTLRRNSNQQNSSNIQNNEKEKKKNLTDNSNDNCINHPSWSFIIMMIIIILFCYHVLIV